MYVSPDIEQEILLYSLKAKIKGLSLQIKEIKNNLKKKPKKVDISGFSSEVCKQQITINRLAREVRHYLLAYNLIRGIPYSSKEKKRLTKPNASIVFEIIKHHVPVYTLGGWSLEIVETILDIH